MKKFKANICKGRLPVSECVSANSGDREVDHASTGCVIGLGLLRYSQALLHTSLVYECIHRTKIRNLLLWLMCFLWMPILPLFLLVLLLIQPFAVCVSAKVPLPIVGN